MQYKTIIHEMLQQRPQMHDQLRKDRKLLPTLELYARELKTSHEAWKKMLSEARPGSDQTQIASEALEMALKEIEDHLASALPRRRERTADPRRGDAVPPPSHVARLKASRNQPTLFDSLSTTSSPATPTPAAVNGGTVQQSPPGRNGNSVHPSLPDGYNQSAPAAPAAAAGSLASGEKAKARDIIAAIRTLKRIEEEQRPATSEEQQALARFAGFGPVALSIFPDPVTGRYKDAGWQAVGEELKTLLTPEEYDSAKRTTFNAFYTSPTVIAAIHEAIARLGVPGDATVLEPGCGIGNFMSQGKTRNALYRRRTRFHLRPHRQGAATPARTSASRTSATPSCPKTASTR